MLFTEIEFEKHINSFLEYLLLTFLQIHEILQIHQYIYPIYLFCIYIMFVLYFIGHIFVYLYIFVNLYIFVFVFCIFVYFCKFCICLLFSLDGFEAKILKYSMCSCTFVFVCVFVLSLSCQRQNPDMFLRRNFWRLARKQNVPRDKHVAIWFWGKLVKGVGW